jgi:hypothetical protein
VCQLSCNDPFAVGTLYAISKQLVEDRSTPQSSGVHLKVAKSTVSNSMNENENSGNAGSLLALAIQMPMRLLLHGGVLCGTSHGSQREYSLRKQRSKPQVSEVFYSVLIDLWTDWVDVSE